MGSRAERPGDDTIAVKSDRRSLFHTGLEAASSTRLWWWTRHRYALIVFGFEYQENLAYDFISSEMQTCWDLTTGHALHLCPQARLRVLSWDDQADPTRGVSGWFEYTVKARTLPKLYHCKHFWTQRLKRMPNASVLWAHFLTAQDTTGHVLCHHMATDCFWMGRHRPRILVLRNGPYR